MASEKPSPTRPAAELREGAADAHLPCTSVSASVCHGRLHTRACSPTPSAVVAHGSPLVDVNEGGRACREWWEGRGGTAWARPSALPGSPLAQRECSRQGGRDRLGSGRLSQDATGRDCEALSLFSVCLGLFHALGDQSKRQPGEE